MAPTRASSFFHKQKQIYKNHFSGLSVNYSSSIISNMGTERCDRVNSTLVSYSGGSGFQPGPRGLFVLTDHLHGFLVAVDKFRDI
jgi:hypothetical protein